MARQIMIPGYGFYHEAGTKQVMIPGYGFFNETVAVGGDINITPPQANLTLSPTAPAADITHNRTVPAADLVHVGIRTAFREIGSQGLEGIPVTALCAIRQSRKLVAFELVEHR